MTVDKDKNRHFKVLKSIKDREGYEKTVRVLQTVMNKLGKEEKLRADQISVRNLMDTFDVLMRKPNLLSVREIIILTKHDLKRTGGKYEGT